MLWFYWNITIKIFSKRFTKVTVRSKEAYKAKIRINKKIRIIKELKKTKQDKK